MPLEAFASELDKRHPSYNETAPQYHLLTNLAHRYKQNRGRHAQFNELQKECNSLMPRHSVTMIPFGTGDFKLLFHNSPRNCFRFHVTHIAITFAFDSYLHFWWEHYETQEQSRFLFHLSWLSVF